MASFGFRFDFALDGDDAAEKTVEQILEKIQSQNTIIEWWVDHWLVFGEVDKTEDLKDAASQYGFQYWLD